MRRGYVQQYSFAPRRVAMTTVSIITATLLSTGAQAQWTQFGGPRQAFTADSTGIAKTWPAEGPPKIWARKLGEGYSSILADSGRLYTMYRTDGEERVISLDAATGKTLWEQGYPSSPSASHDDTFGNGPNATPLLTDGRLYTIGIAGLMHCMDAADGKVIWSRQLWKQPRDRHPHKFGYSSSPIEYEDTVITAVGEKYRSIVALNKKDGSIVFEALDFANSYSTPMIVKVHGEDQLVAFMGTEAIGADPRTGELKWLYPMGNEWQHNICPPVVIDENTLFFSTLQVGARGLKLVNRDDKTVVEEIWATRKVRAMYFGWVQIGDHLYGSSGDWGSYLFGAVNARTGKVAWRNREFGHASVVSVDGHLIILEENGTLMLATATPEKLTIHAKAQLLETPSWTVPTVVGRTLYIRDVKNIMALDLG